MDPSVNTLPYLYALHAHIQDAITKHASTASFEKFSPTSPLWAKIIDFFERFDTVQVRYGGSEFRRLIEIVARTAQNSSTVSLYHIWKRHVETLLTVSSQEQPFLVSAQLSCALTRRVLVLPRITYFFYACALKLGNMMQPYRFLTKTYIIFRHHQTLNRRKSIRLSLVHRMNSALLL